MIANRVDVSVLGHTIMVNDPGAERTKGELYQMLHLGRGFGFNQQAHFANRGSARGFFIRHCAKNIEDLLIFKVYGHHSGIIPANGHRKNPKNMMFTDAKFMGFVKDKTDSNCMVLNVRGVNKITVVITAHKEDFKEKVLFEISPEYWTATDLSNIFLYASLFIFLLFFALYYKCRSRCFTYDDKVIECVHDIEECDQVKGHSHQDHHKGGKEKKLNGVPFCKKFDWIRLVMLPTLLCISDTASDFWYIFTVPVIDLKLQFFLLLIVWFPIFKFYV